MTRSQIEQLFHENVSQKASRRLTLNVFLALKKGEEQFKTTLFIEAWGLSKF